jgi:hypothetical protein
MRLLLRFGPRELEAPATLFERSGSILLPWRTGGCACCCISMLASWKLPLLCSNLESAVDDYEVAERRCCIVPPKGSERRESGAKRKR